MEPADREELSAFEAEMLKTMKERVAEIQKRMFRTFVENTPSKTDEFLPTGSSEDAYLRNMAPINNVLKAVMREAKTAADKMCTPRLDEILRAENTEFNLTTDEIKRRINDVYEGLVTKFTNSYEEFVKCYESLLPSNEASLRRKQEATILLNLNYVVKTVMANNAECLGEMKRMVNVVLEPKTSNNHDDVEVSKRELREKMEEHVEFYRSALDILTDLPTFIACLDSEESTKMPILSAELPTRIVDLTDLITDEWQSGQKSVFEYAEMEDVDWKLVKTSIENFEKSFKTVHGSFIDFWNTEMVIQPR